MLTQTSLLLGHLCRGTEAKRTYERVREKAGRESRDTSKLGSVFYLDFVVNML